MTSEFFDLFVELNVLLKKYVRTYLKLRHALNESKLGKLQEYTEEDAILDLNNIFTQIEDVLERINQYLFEYKPIPKKDISDINDQYMEIVNQKNNVFMQLQSKNIMKQFPDVEKLHTTVLKKLNALDTNIVKYNKFAVLNNWGFTIISPKEAEEKYGEMIQLAIENSKKLQKDLLN